MPRHKEGGDGEEVVGKLAWAAPIPVSLGTAQPVENHEFCPSFPKDVLQEFGSKAAQPVPVHDHNLRDISSVDLVHQGAQSLALEVEARADVLDDLVVWVLGLEVFNLPDEVLFLAGAADPCVEDPLSLVVAGFDDAFFRLFVSEKLGKMVGVVEAPSAATGAHTSQLACMCPVAQRLAGDVVPLANRC